MEKEKWNEMLHKIKDIASQQITVLTDLDNIIADVTRLKDHIEKTQLEMEEYFDNFIKEGGK